MGKWRLLFVVREFICAEEIKPLDLMYLYEIAKTFSVIHTNFESRLFQILSTCKLMILHLTSKYCNIDNGIVLQFNSLPVTQGIFEERYEKYFLI